MEESDQMVKNKKRDNFESSGVNSSSDLSDISHKEALLSP